MAHTPGPWRIIKQLPYGHQLPVFKIFGKTEQGHDRYITEINLISTELENEEAANATLISAAPELLEALEAMNDKLNKCFQYELSDDLDGLLRSMSDEVEAAIAKAKGE